MAKATYPPSPVTLVLSESEAQLIFELTGNVGGSKCALYQESVDVYEALKALGFSSKHDLETIILVPK